MGVLKRNYFGPLTARMLGKHDGEVRDDRYTRGRFRNPAAACRVCGEMWIVDVCVEERIRGGQERSEMWPAVSSGETRQILN